jgi:UDP-glucuronate decarboxylase
MGSPAAFTGPVNLGNPVEMTMKELAQTILQLTGSASPLVFQKLPLDDPKQRRPDITLAERALGFCPKVSLKEGLTHTIAYFKERVCV